MIRDKLFILSSTACPTCKQLKRIVGRKLPIYDVLKSNEALDLAVEHNILGMPAAVKRVGKNFRECELVVSADKVTIECGKSPVVFRR